MAGSVPDDASLWLIAVGSNNRSLSLRGDSPQVTLARAVEELRADKVCGDGEIRYVLRAE